MTLSPFRTVSRPAWRPTEVRAMAREMTVIRQDIEETRERLRDTAEALGWKIDIP
jgi:hypothetical protein